MPRQNFTDGMELTFGDLSKLPVRTEKELYDRVLFQMLQGVEDAFFGSGLLVTRTSSTELQIASGLGFQTDSTVVSPEPTKRLIYQEAVESVSIEAPDATNDRIDLVCVRAARSNTSSATRKFKDASTSVISNETLVIETDWEPVFLVVEGTPAGSPAAPAVPSGYLKLAEVVVTAVTGIAASGAITDTRDSLPVGGDIQLDTSALTQITSGVDTKLKTVISDIDSKLSQNAISVEDASNWDGSTKVHTYDVSALTDDARKMIWALKANGDNWKDMGGEIDHPTATQVRVTFGVDIASGTYTLVGR